MTDGQTASVIRAMREGLLKAAAEGDSVAIPGFGTFVTVKEDERVDRDLSTGRNVLLPPHLEIQFKESATLRHSLTAD